MKVRMAAMLAFGLLLTYQQVIAEDDALAMLRQALKKHEGIAGVKIVADVEGVRQGGRITFEKLGNRMRFDGILATEETSEKRQVWLDEFNKSGKPIEWASYDGKRLINYYPLGMRLIVRSMTTPMFPRCVFQIDPAYWGKLDMGFEYKGFALKEVETKKNVHRFHEKFGERSTAFTELFIEADENQGWNITHVESIGGIQGREIVDVSWAEKEGRWYPKTGKRTLLDIRGGVVTGKWEIVDITFDLKSIRTDYGYDETKLPLGTQVSIEDSIGKKKIHYVGGEEGETLFRLQKGIRAVKD